MTIKDNLSLGFDKINKIAGKQIRVRYYTQVVGSVWDDEVTLTQSGNDLWTSGVVFPVSNKRGSSDSVLLEQGKLLDEDQKLFVNGSLSFTGSELQVKIGLGSPVSAEFTTIPIGAKSPEVEGQKIYRKTYIRIITGSLLGE